jgi:hypothetical protein
MILISFSELCYTAKHCICADEDQAVETPSKHIITNKMHEKGLPDSLSLASELDVSLDTIVASCSCGLSSHQTSLHDHLPCMPPRFTSSATR